MKPKAIILIVVLAVLIAVIIGTYGDVSSSVSFKEAAEYPEKTFHVQGVLMKEMPVEYDPVKDPNYFTFFVKDKEGDVKKVIAYQPKVQDFERTESVSMNGKMRGDDFHAEKIMLKCPSKYEEEAEKAESQI